MRKLISYVLFVCFVPICSCTNQDDNPKTAIEDTKVEVLSPNPTHGFRSVNLAENELNINLYIPEKFYEDEDGFPRFIQPNIKHNLGEARWEITLPGHRRWHLVIEEMGKDSSGVLEEIERLKNIDFFDYNFHVKTDSTLIYSRSLKANKTTLDSTELIKSANYHFYCNRIINDYNLVFRSYEMKDFRKITTDKMLKSALYAF